MSSDLSLILESESTPAYEQLKRNSGKWKGSEAEQKCNARDVLTASWRGSKPYDHPRSESQGLLAFIQNAWRSLRHDEALAPRPGTCLSQMPMGRSCSSTSNRLMRIRMSGGVGGDRAKPVPYPDLGGTYAPIKRSYSA
jgi:hypothetical protein